MSNIHLLCEKSISDLKLKAKKLSKTNSISLSQALQEVAASIGFTNWKDLISTYKFETDQRYYMAHIQNDFSGLRPFEAEADVLRNSMLKLKGIDIDAYNDLKNPLRYFSLSDDEREKFEALQKTVRSIERISEDETAKKHGFLSWNELKKKYVKQVIIEKYTDEQKIGAIARRLSIDPRSLKNTVHVMISSDNQTIGIDNQTWEQFGFYEDLTFSNWIQENDPYFAEEAWVVCYRLVAIDTTSYKKVFSSLQKIAKNMDFFFPLIPDLIWINGNTDPEALKIDPDYPNEVLPLATLPDDCWKRGY